MQPLETGGGRGAEQDREGWGRALEGQTETNLRAAQHVFVALNGIFIVKHSLALHCLIKMQNEQMPHGLMFLMEIP